MVHQQFPHDPRAIDGLISQGNLVGALNACRPWTQQKPRDPAAWSALARAAFAFGLNGEARHAATQLLALSPNDQHMQFLLAMSDHNTGRSDEAISRLDKVIAARSPLSPDAARALAYVLEQAGRSEALDAHIGRGGEWLQDERAVTFQARRLAHKDRPAAIALLTKVAKSGRSPATRRTAGFAAVTMLDADGRYREAFDLATAVHRDTTGPFNLAPMQADVAAQQEYLRALAERRAKDGAASHEPSHHGEGSAPAAAGARQAAFIVALPRSGTTLVEHMLDRHSCIGGIGEYEGVARIKQSVNALGLTLPTLGDLQPHDAARIRADYLSEASARVRSGTTFTLDKSLQSWRYLPWLAVVLPDARYIHLQRDPRDRAISTFLSSFHATRVAYTSSLDAIRQFAWLERQLVPAAIQALGLRALHVQYEHLVADPETEARRMLQHLGLPYEPAVLAPERNQRSVLTLSAQQVRRSINDRSIGRWRNYDFAFGPEWDELCARGSGGDGG